MAIVYGNPTYTATIATSGLYLHYDAGNVASYPGSGTTWTDLSGNGYNATISGTYAYSSSNGGSIQFNAGVATDGMAQFQINNSAFYNASTITVEMWSKFNRLNSEMPFGWGPYDVYSPGATGSENLGFNTAAGDAWGITNSKVVNLGLMGNWKHYTFIMQNGVSTGAFTLDNKIYINSQLQTLVNLQGDISRCTVNNMSFNTGSGQICGWRNDTGYRMGQNVGVLRIYNRELTQKEIFLNFETQRTRFGV